MDERSRDWLVEMAAICQEKIPTLNHIIPYTDFFFAAPTAYDEKGDRKFFRQDTSLQALEAALECMRQADEWTVTALKESYEAAAEQKELKIGGLLNGTRLALTGKTVGPGLYELVKLLGREESVQRMEAALNYIKTSGEGTA